MSSFAIFVIVAALLLAAALAALVLPLLRPPKLGASTAHRAANLDVLRDQLRELERERDECLLSAEDFAEARAELQRRLLDEAHGEQPAEALATGGSGSRKSAWFLLLSLPIAAVALYLLLGNPRALDPLQRQAPAQINAQQIDAMVAKLQGKLKDNPNDAQGWLMLARSYKTLERFSEAADAYARAIAADKAIEQNASVLADYAGALGEANDGSLRGQPEALLARALKIDANEAQALFLSGVAASQRQDFAAAAKHWERLQNQLDPNAEETQALREAIGKARALADERGQSKAANAATAVGGEVRISAQLAAQAKPDDVLFVFARAEDGERMPLAAMRASVGELPLRFVLDDSKALPGGRKLSEFKSFTVEARIAKSGMAQSGSGDFYGRVSGVKPGQKNLRIVIDRVQP